MRAPSAFRTTPSTDSPAPRRPPPRRTGIWILVTATGLVIVGIWVAVWFESGRARMRALERGGADVSNLAIAFAAHVERTILGIDQALLTIRDQIRRTEGGVKLKGAADAAPALRNLDAAVAILDRDGVMVDSNLGIRPENVSLADRFFFAAHRSGGDHMVVGEPIVSPITFRCNFSVSRPLMTGGGLGGVLVVSIPPSSLVDLFASVSLGRDGAVALIGNMGVTWVRAGSAPSGCGRMVHDRVRHAAARLAGQGVMDVPSRVDGIDRIIGFRPVSGLPLQVFVGAAKPYLLEGARREARRYAAFAAVLTLVLAVGVLLIARNLERRRRAQATLRGLNRRLAEARRTAEARSQQLAASLYGVRDGISIFDGGMRLVLSNASHRTMMAYPEELVRPGTPVRAFLRFQAARGDFGRDVDPDQEADRRVARLREESLEKPERLSPAGRHLELRRSFTADGSMVTVYRDVTEERRQMADLAEARRAAMAAAERKSELLAVVGHEIRTPMTGILGFMKLIEGTQLTLEQRTYIGIATSSSQALLALLDDLLTHSRIEAGRLALQLSEWQLDSLLQDTSALFTPAAARKGVRIRWRRGPDLPEWIVTDGVRLRQLVGNLVANAVRLTPAGEILIAAERLHSPPGDSARPVGWVRISVADRGPGIPQWEKQQIFEPYVQGRAGAEQGEGSGLGLAICRRLVELFGGEIGVVDRDGGGVEFWFTLPLLPAPVPDPEPDHGAAGPRLRVLLVEDNPANQFLARRFLEKLGHEVTVVSEAATAAARIEAEAFDLIVVDRRLGEGDGLALLRRVRAGGHGGAVAIIMATATTAGDAREEALAAGADEFLCKPYSIRMLAEAIQRSRERHAP